MIKQFALTVNVMSRVYLRTSTSLFQEHPFSRAMRLGQKLIFSERQIFGARSVPVLTGTAFKSRVSLKEDSSQNHSALSLFQCLFVKDV